MHEHKRHRWMIVLTIAVTVSLLVPTAVWASHQFTDVPDSNVFHNAIAWMKDKNITVGCNPPANTKYCPSDNVTRGQMAAFMKRLAENQVVDAGSLSGKTAIAYERPVAIVTGDFTDGTEFGGQNGTISSINLTAPAAGTFIVQITGSWNTGGVFTIGAWAEMDTTTPCDNFLDGDEILGTWAPATNSQSHAGQGSVTVTSAGTHTFYHCLHTFSSVSDNTSHGMVVTWYPTGSTTTG